MLVAHAVVVTAVLVNLSAAPKAVIEAAKVAVVELFAEIGVALCWIGDDKNGTGPRPDEIPLGNQGIPRDRRRRAALFGRR